MTKQVAPFITTFTGRRFYFLDPKPDMVCIEDIAQALSNTCRFTGHVREFYSVAEHSVRVAQQVPAKFVVPALLHDAAEAYLVDLPRPLKQFVHVFVGDSLVPYNVLESATLHVIAQAFDFTWKEHAEVKEADNRMLASEYRALMHWDPEEDLPMGIRDCGEPYADVQSALSQRCMSPSMAAREFLRFADDVLNLD
tara:strand:- start:298 stop:885 length:588 start_codon:yes stop_codon:yes gene_type:complete